MCAAAFVGDLIILVMNVERWTTRGTLEMLDWTMDASDGVPATGTLVQHLGSFHQPAQRKLMMDTMVERRIPVASTTAVLTDSAVLRAIMTAWSWLTASRTAAFSPHDARCAIDWLVEQRRITDVRLVLKELHACQNLLMPASVHTDPP